jgi:hypothetical protein
MDLLTATISDGQITTLLGIATTAIGAWSGFLLKRESDARTALQKCEKGRRRDLKQWLASMEGVRTRLEHDDEMD